MSNVSQGLIVGGSADWLFGVNNKASSKENLWAFVRCERVSNAAQGIVYLHPFFHFFPTAIALGSSAIVKVSGQNCFRTLVLWGRSVLGRQKVPQKVPPRFYQGSTKVAQVSWCLWSSGADPFWATKRFCGRFHHHFLKLVSQFLNSFLHFSPTALASGSSAIIVKVLGQNDTFFF